MIKRILAVSLLGGCTVLQPPLPEAKPDLPPSWPIPATSNAQEPTEVGWRDFLVDERLETLVARALENNRDLRVAVLNVERARNLYRIQRAARVPSVGANLQLQRLGGDNVEETRLYSAGVGVSGFELDLFGRVRSLSDAALREYFATEENRRAAQLTLLAEVANAYLTLAADRDLMRVAQAARQNRETWFGLTQKRFELGATSRLDLAQARTLVESARADAAQFEGQVARDVNALNLLVGSPVEEALLPPGLDREVGGITPVPAGLPSEVLLRRPDVRAAEEHLRAANANIGAARAAFFPSISLTGSVGMASGDLSSLFSGSSFVWSFLPRIDLPIFDLGRRSANLGVATADRDIALAQYEKAIQSSFREAADALALSRTLAEQRAAQEENLKAAEEAQELSRVRYEGGRDSFLVLLDAQRTLYAAQQAVIATRLAEQSNRVALYKVLGGGWKENS